jgi:hypothetical protein
MLPGVTPEVIRHTACEIAAEGLAGRGALTAARGALKGEQEARLLANFDLLLEVVRQIEPKGQNPIPPEEDRPAEVERRAKRAVPRIAPRLRCSPEAVVERLDSWQRSSHASASGAATPASLQRLAISFA